MEYYAFKFVVGVVFVTAVVSSGRLFHIRMFPSEVWKSPLSIIYLTGFPEFRKWSGKNETLQDREKSGNFILSPGKVGRNTWAHRDLIKKENLLKMSISMNG